MRISSKALLVLVGLVPCLLPGARADDAPSERAIAAAIARGVAFLKGQQAAEGSWSYSYNHDHELGITALAGLALLENGVARTDPAIVRAGAVVRQLAETSYQTYDLSLAILFLARVQAETRGPNDALILRLANRLAEGGEKGMWTYLVPREESRPARTSRLLRRRFEPGDNSNTQFALLGLWAAGRHGFANNATLAAIDEHFRTSRERDGRWGYRPKETGSEAMTCAGLMGLAIAAARPEKAERRSARALGAALAADPAFIAALKVVARDARALGAESDIYYLWSLERVCVALGIRDLDGFDWYAKGAAELLRRQLPDGSWPNTEWRTLPNTCLALLFLRKANLAFELDRVLKLPGGAAPEPAGATEPALKSDAPGDAEARVVVTGTSDRQFPEIAVEFEVKRPDGSFLLDGEATDFHVTEDGRPVTIDRLEAPRAAEAHPVTVVLVVDRSRSMEEEDRIGALKRAVATFVSGLPAGSRVAVIAFGSNVETICPFTSDPEKVRAAIDALTPEGATRYYDAIAEALELLNREPGRRAVLALTDGEDTFSQAATLDSTIVAARRLGLPVHTLGLGSEDEIEGASLRRLAESTRGQYYAARQADQLRSIYEQLAERLRSTYRLVYKTDRKLPDGTLRPVRVAYRESRQVGEASVFIPGMVVPAAGWPGLFLALVVILTALALLPTVLTRPRQR